MKTCINKQMVTALLILVVHIGNAGSRESELKDSSGVIISTEATMKIEEWMVDEKTWNIQYISVPSEQEKENPLLLEDWMIRESIFIVKDSLSVPEKERSLKVELWMIDPGIWVGLTERNLIEN